MADILKAIEELVCNKKQCEEKDIRIVILQRGWVMVGAYEQKDNMCYLYNASVIRRWGTTEGLGQLTNSGPLSETILDACGTVEFHILNMIANLKCDYNQWKKHV